MPVNLAEFVAATAGRHGTVAHVPGGVVVAGPMAIANGYQNTALPTSRDIDPSEFLDRSRDFFGELNREFVLWVPKVHEVLVELAIEHGGVEGPGPTPAMIARNRVAITDRRFTITEVVTPAARLTLADVIERGYDKPGLGWLLDHIGAFDAPGTTWALAHDEHGTPVSAACGYRASDNSGGLYYVATPVEHRGRGAGAAVSAWVTNTLVDHGVTSVSLQASLLGLPVYERLGFEIVDAYRRFAFGAAAQP